MSFPLWATLTLNVEFFNYLLKFVEVHFSLKFLGFTACAAPTWTTIPAEVRYDRRR